MKIIIKLKDNKDPERVLDYYYVRTLDLFDIGEISGFEIEIEGTKLKRKRV